MFETRKDFIKFTCLLAFIGLMSGSIIGIIYRDPIAPVVGMAVGALLSVALHCLAIVVDWFVNI
jgi:uncharacterized membrane protein